MQLLPKACLWISCCLFVFCEAWLLGGTEAAATTQSADAPRTPTAVGGDGTDGNPREAEQSEVERPGSSRTPSVSSRQSIHVAVPPNVRPGEKFFVVVDDMEYEVIAPEGCAPGEMIAMDILADLRSLEGLDEQAPSIILVSPDTGPGPVGSIGSSKGDLEYEASVAESVATDASIVQITVPDGCQAGDTFFAAVHGLEFEILVPKGSNPGDVITLEVPSKHAIGKFATPDPMADVPSILVRDAMASQGSSNSDVFAEIEVPENAVPGQTFVAVIDNVEFDVPVPETLLPFQILFLV